MSTQKLRASITRALQKELIEINKRYHMNRQITDLVRGIAERVININSYGQIYDDIELRELWEIGGVLSGLSHNNRILALLQQYTETFPEGMEMAMG